MADDGKDVLPLRIKPEVKQEVKREVKKGS
jgi:hypothetical protein